MINKDKLHKYLQQWREIAQQERDLDHTKSTWCRNVRGEFSRGDQGDEAFIQLCMVDLGMTRVMGEEMLLRATAAEIVPDARTWNRLGGFRSIRALETLPKRDRVSVIEAAKVGDKSIQTLIRERTPVVANSNDYVSPKADARALAEYLLSTGGSLPKRIKGIVERYAAKSNTAAA